MTANIHDIPGDFIHDLKIPGVVAQLAAVVDPDGRIRGEVTKDDGTLAVGEMFAGPFDAIYAEKNVDFHALADIGYDIWVKDMADTGTLSEKPMETAAATALYAVAGTEFNEAMDFLLLQNNFYAWKYTYRVCWQALQNKGRNCFKPENRQEFIGFFEDATDPEGVASVILKKLPWPVAVRIGICPDGAIKVKALREMFPNAYTDLERLSDLAMQMAALTPAADAAKVIAETDGYPRYRSAMHELLVEHVDSFLSEAGGTGSIELPRKFPKKPIRPLRQAAEVVQFSPPQQMQPPVQMQPPPVPAPKYNTAIVQQEKQAIIDEGKAVIAEKDAQIQQAVIALQNAEAEKQQLMEALAAPKFPTANDMAVDVGVVSSLPAPKYSTEDKIMAIKQAKDQLTKEYQAELERKDRAIAAMLEQANAASKNKYNTAYVAAKVAEKDEAQAAYVKRALDEQYTILDYWAAQLIQGKEEPLKAEIARLKALLAKQQTGTQYTAITAPKQAIIYDKAPVDPARVSVVSAPAPTTPAVVPAAPAPAVVVAAPAPVVEAAPAVVPVAAVVPETSEYEKALAIAKFWWKKHPRAEKVDKSKLAKTIVTRAEDYIPNRTDFQGIDTK